MGIHRPLVSLPRLVLLALFFAAGVLLGQAMAGRVPASTGEELNRYLTDYIRLDSEASPTVEIVLSALVLYFRYPLLAFFLGFASIGIILLPCLTAAFGFFCLFPCAALRQHSVQTVCWLRWRCSACGVW